MYAGRPPTQQGGQPYNTPPSQQQRPPPPQAFQQGTGTGTGSPLSSPPRPQQLGQQSGQPRPNGVYRPQVRPGPPRPTMSSPTLQQRPIMPGSRPGPGPGPQGQINRLQLRSQPSREGMRPPPQTQSPPVPQLPNNIDSMARQFNNMSVDSQQAQSPSIPPPKSKRAQRVYNQEGGQAPVSQSVPQPQHQHQQPYQPQQPQQSQPQPQPQPYPISNQQSPYPSTQQRPPPQQHSSQPPPPTTTPYGPPQPGQPPQALSNIPYQGQQQQSSNRNSNPLAARNRIDPEAVPSPITVQEMDMRMYSTALGGEPFLTLSKKAVPLASTDFVGLDQGSSNPRFVRLTTYTLPTTEDLLNHTHMPLGLVIQPFAKLKPQEGSIPVVDFGENGPIRCRRCKSYINPFAFFIEGGSKYVCNMCGFANEVPQEYFCNLDMSGRRMDLDERPELRFGTCEFKVPKEYWVKDIAPKALSFVFCIDVSWTSIESGMLAVAVKALKETLYGESDAGGIRVGLHPGARIGIMTYDRSVHFYNLSSTLDQAQMLVVPDINDMFVPMSEGFLVDPMQSRIVIEGLLDSLPSLFAGNKATEPVLGAVVKAVQMALGDSGGKAFILQTALPSFGPGALKPREDPKLYNTEKERTLFAAQDNFYKMASQDLVEAGIGVDLFLFPNAYIDVATVGLLAGITGGEIYFYPNFRADRDGGKFAYELNHAVTRETGYNVLMRTRCSNGLRVHDHFGNFYQRNITDLEFGTIDADKAVGVLVKYDGKLDEKQDAYFQSAILYTTAEGERRVRTHNIAIPVTSSLGNVFRYADMDTTVNFMSKEATSQLLTKPLREVRDHLTEKCVKILLSYRRNCASTTAKGQLILPEAYKLFPLYALAMIKSKALRGLNMASDVRTYHMRLIKSIGVASSIALFYPRLLAVHNLASDVGPIEGTGDFKLPSLLRTSFSRLDPKGAYVLENGEYLFLWIGGSIPPQWLQDVFGIDSLQNVDVFKGVLPNLDNPTSKQLVGLVEYLQRQRPKGIARSIVIARQQLDGAEVEFMNMLVEDANADAMSYVDYLCYVHKQIQDEVNRGHD